MNRKKRSPEELRNASDHLLYEIWMLDVLAHGLASGIAGEGAMNNALLESFTLHARVLLDFLYDEKPHDDDVVATDFFASEQEWLVARPAKSEKVQMVHRRVGKEVAHLTYARQNMTPEMKQWPFAEIASEIIAASNVFVTMVPAELLGTRWHEHFAQAQKNQTA